MDSEGYRKISFRGARLKKLLFAPVKNNVAEQVDLVFRIDQVAAAALGRKSHLYDDQGRQLSGIRRLELDNQYFGADLKLIPAQGSLFVNQDAGSVQVKSIAIVDFKITAKETGLVGTCKARVDGTADVLIPFMRCTKDSEITIEIHRATEDEEKAASERYGAQLTLVESDESEAEDDDKDEANSEPEEDQPSNPLNDDTPIEVGVEVVAASEEPDRFAGLPDPGEDGTFDLEAAEKIRYDGDNVDAVIYHLETRDGFRADYECRLKRAEVHLPSVTIATPAFLSERQAISVAAVNMAAFLTAIRAKFELGDNKVKPKKYHECGKVLNWLSQYIQTPIQRPLDDEQTAGAPEVVIQ